MRSPDGRLSQIRRTQSRRSSLVGVLFPILFAGCQPAERIADSTAVRDSAPIGDSAKARSAMPALDGAPPYEGDLGARTLSEYATSPRDFWDDFGPKDWASIGSGWITRPQSGKEYGIQRVIQRNCRDGSTTCEVAARAIGRSRHVELDKIPAGGTVMGIFRLYDPSSGKTEAGYEIKRRSALFLVAFPDATPNPRRGTYRLVRIFLEGTLRIDIKPPLNQPAFPFIDCDVDHAGDSGDYAGFESCEMKKEASDALKASVRRLRADSASAFTELEAQGSFIAYLDRIARARSTSAGRNLIWTTCHAGCCQARPL